MNSPDGLLGSDPSYNFVTTWITNRVTGEAFSHQSFVKSLSEAIELARLTWYDREMWGISFQPEPKTSTSTSTSTSTDSNPFRDSLINQEPNPFRESLLI